MTHGAAFLDTSVRRLDKHVRQLGRRLLCWPAGAPNAAVLGKPFCLVAFARPSLVACTVVLLLGSFATLLACQVLGQLELLKP